MGGTWRILKKIIARLSIEMSKSNIPYRKYGSISNADLVSANIWGGLEIKVRKVGCKVVCGRCIEELVGCKGFMIKKKTINLMKQQWVWSSGNGVNNGLIV